MKGGTSLQEVESVLDMSCEATRDLYLFMLGIVSPLTEIAKERMESAKRKLNPTEEEKNPNMKFVENSLAAMLDGDPDFQKLLKKKKFEWDQYDIFLRKIYSSVREKAYFQKYMESETRSLAEDCRLFKKIFEQEFEQSVELENILEDMSIYWNDDLGYALIHLCKAMDDIAKTGRWKLPPLYQSEMKPGPDIESDRYFVHKLLQNAYGGYEKYSAEVSGSVSNWERDRIVLTDMALIVMGMAEAQAFPTIPVKVTINEYVDIASYYGTPKSRGFVNGLLDKMIHKMSDEGRISKTGRGLM